MGTDEAVRAYMGHLAGGQRASLHYLNANSSVIELKEIGQAAQTVVDTYEGVGDVVESIFAKEA